MDIEERLKDMEARLWLLEQGRKASNDPPVLEMDLTLPEENIDGLHFNETRVHAVFERQDDGWYYSRDILFVSARDVEDDNSRDILMEYLESGAVKEAFCACLDTDTKSYFSRIKVSLPQKPQGIKKYNGGYCWYWLSGAISAISFCATYHDGGYHCYGASIVGGCAPAFRVVQGGNH
jgi:hypothetical protein